MLLYAKKHKILLIRGSWHKSQAVNFCAKKSNKIISASINQQSVRRLSKKRKDVNYRLINYYNFIPFSFYQSQQQNTFK